MRALRTSLLPLIAVASSACSLVLQTPALTTPAVVIPPGLTAAGPVRCEANQELQLRNAYVTGEGPGVTALGNCELIIEGSTIDVTGVALQIADNGKVTVRNSRISGTGGAYTISNNGALTTSGTVFVGRRNASENGEAVDQGGNTYND